MARPNRADASAPLLVLGLGNPGGRYENTRHNVGYQIADLLAERWSVKFRRRFSSLFSHTQPVRIRPESRPFVLIRWLGYMNHSGNVMLNAMRRYRAGPEDFLVVVDNMDLSPGTCRLRKGGGNAGHNGLKSIINAAGGNFFRLYVGVGRPFSGDSVVEHVLGRPDSSDRVLLEQASVEAAQAIENLTEKPFERVAEELNKRER